MFRSEFYLIKNILRQSFFLFGSVTLTVASMSIIPKITVDVPFNHLSIFVRTLMDATVTVTLSNNKKDFKILKNLGIPTTKFIFNDV